MKKELVSCYLGARFNKNPNAFDRFLTRCRKLRELRDLGLKYVIFCPKLASQVEQMSLCDWERWKTLLKRKEVESEVDTLIGRHCPKWFEILKRMYPRWDMESFPTGQLHSAPQQGEQDAEYVPS